MSRQAFGMPLLAAPKVTVDVLRLCVSTEAGTDVRSLGFPCVAVARW